MLSSIVNQNKLNNSPLPQIIYVKTFQLYIVGLINFSIIIILFWLNVITYTKKHDFAIERCQNKYNYARSCDLVPVVRHRGHCISAQSRQNPYSSQVTGGNGWDYMYI